MITEHLEGKDASFNSAWGLRTWDSLGHNSLCRSLLGSYDPWEYCHLCSQPCVLGGFHREKQKSNKAVILTRKLFSRC